MPTQFTIPTTMQAISRNSRSLGDAWPEINPTVPENVRRLCESLPLKNPAWVSAAHPDARVFAQLVISQVRPGRRVLDLGTGTGLCAICLARLGYDVSAADLSPPAVRCARRNAIRHGLNIEVVVSDLLESVEGHFDLIAFNLPYSFTRDNWARNLAKNLARRVPWIRQSSGYSMPGAVQRFHQGLVARLVAQAAGHLKPGGSIVLHAFECEVAALADVLPDSTDLLLLRHPALAANGTIGLKIGWP
ncbi:MAG: methyltransferase [Planctomycetes bacterium]|nr:methyltransferase [Planctomycetota bacterium]